MQITGKTMVALIGKSKSWWLLLGFLAGLWDGWGIGKI